MRREKRLSPPAAVARCHRQFQNQQAHVKSSKHVTDGSQPIVTITAFCGVRARAHNRRRAIGDKLATTTAAATTTATTAIATAPHSNKAKGGRNAQLINRHAFERRSRVQFTVQIATAFKVCARLSPTSTHRSLARAQLRINQQSPRVSPPPPPLLLLAHSNTTITMTRLALLSVALVVTLPLIANASFCGPAAIPFSFEGKRASN